jgi:hypothetical protein
MPNPQFYGGQTRRENRFGGRKTRLFVANKRRDNQHSFVLDDFLAAFFQVSLFLGKKIKSRCGIRTRVLLIRSQTLLNSAELIGCKIMAGVGIEPTFSALQTDADPSQLSSRGETMDAERRAMKKHFIVSAFIIHRFF